MSYDSDAFHDNTIRFLDKEVNECELDNYREWWAEQIDLYGTKVSYYTTNHALSSSNRIYGEDMTKAYSDPKDLIMAMYFNTASIILGVSGLIADDEIASFVSIDVYESIFGEGKEPISGDVFELTEVGSDRPNGRSGKKFEVTERLDEELSQINQLLGHYVWLLKAKRFDFSHEPGLTTENLADQVDDDPIVDDLAKDSFDYSLFDNDDDVYGDYR